MMWGWPQIWIVVWVSISVGVSMAWHGTPMVDVNGNPEKRNFFVNVSRVFMILFPLYMGGFFS